MDNKASYIYPKDKNYPAVKKSKGSSINTSNGGRTAYLTFDDGPSNQSLRVMDVLKSYGIKATFFVIGLDTPFGRNAYERIVKEGHQIGNHSYTHDYSSIYRSVQSFMQDFLKLDKLLESVTGTSTDLIRFPGGSNNTRSHRYGNRGIMQQIIAEITMRGYTYCDWNVDAGDSTNAISNPNLIVRNVLEQSAGKMNAVILLHDGGYQRITPSVLPQIIEGLISQGFNFSALSKGSFNVQFR